MAERAKFFDDIAGVAGGAFSALAGVGEEMGALIRTRVDEALARLALVRREEFEVVAELAAAARAGQEQAEARLAALEARLGRIDGQPAPAATVSNVQMPTTEPSEVDSLPEAHDPHGSHGAPGGPPAGHSGDQSEGPLPPL